MAHFYSLPRGFTLPELITSLAVLGILTALAYPSFANLLLQSRVETVTEELQAAVQLTRQHAVMANSRANLAAVEKDWELGWELYLDHNHNGQQDEDEPLLQTGDALHDDVRVHANRPVSRYISYLGTGESRWASGYGGGAFQAGRFSICPREAGAGYELILSRGGRMRKTDISKEECNAL